jgi:choloylglycine hydrolase
MVGDALLVVNKRGVSKVSLARDDPAAWTSRFGSLTFNQYGREQPLGGMNQAGLVVACMWLQSTRYPQPDSRPQLGELEWIQYQLDTASRVREVIASHAKLRIARAGAPVHFLACDRTGACATIEFLDGQMVVHSGESLPTPVLTNNTYARSLAYCEEAEKGTALGGESLRRFHQISRGLSGYDSEASGPALAYAFNLLESVSRTDTQWSVVFDQTLGRVHFRSRRNRTVRWVDLADFDLSCSSPVAVLNLSEGRAGDVRPLFEPYSYQANYDLIRKTFAATEFLRDTPVERLRGLARHPEGMPCTLESGPARDGR